MDKKKRNPSFDIDMILAEVEEKKTKRSGQPGRPADIPRPEEGKTEQSVSSAAEVPAAAQAESASKPQRAQMDIFTRSRAAAAARPLPAAEGQRSVSTKAEERSDESFPVDKREDASLPRLRPVIMPSAAPEADEDVKVFVPKGDRTPDSARVRSAGENAPAPVAPAPAISEPLRKAEEAVDRGERRSGVSPASSETEHAGAAGQLHLERLLEERERSDRPQEDDTSHELERQLRQARRKKVESFKLAGDEEEDNDPAEEPDPFEDGELEDYSSYSETEAVGEELTYRRRMNWIQMILTGAMELLLIVLGLMSLLMHRPPLEAHLFVTVNLFLLCVMSLVNHRLVGEGIASLFRMKADADSGSAAAVLFTLIHTALQYAGIEAVASGKTPVLAPVAGFCLLLGCAGRLMLVKRVGLNFRFVSFRGEKRAAHVIEDPQTAEEVGRSAAVLGEPAVAYYRKANFLTHFLRHSYDDDGAVRPMRLYVPLAVAASLLLGALCYLLTRSLGNALTAAAAACCCSAPAAAFSAVHFPLLRGCSRVLRRGGMIVGWRAVESFGALDALALDAQDLFPAESVLLHGIKTFSGMRIDEAILDAAAVSTAAGGPLSSVFLRVIENKVDMLPEVDSLVYEQEMGLSGWVGGRRVLVGNRRLLENHGVDVPSRDYESRYARGERRIVYLSTAGELSAMFVVSYAADAGIMRALHSMTGAGVHLLVRTCDPNVTAHRICRIFELNEDLVDVLGVAAGRSYEGLSSPEDAESGACVAANGRAEGMAEALTCCRRLLSAVRLSVKSQVMGGAVGFALVACLALYTGGQLFPPVVMILYLMIWTAVSWGLPFFRGI
ncbi:MAG: hypothetical protein HFJ80_06630 [Clostridiales bacterium]|nr:hypothetical protein [Clostridiales bacterium]